VPCTCHSNSMLRSPVLATHATWPAATVSVSMRSAGRAVLVWALPVAQSPSATNTFAPAISEYTLTTDGPATTAFVDAGCTFTCPLRAAPSPACAVPANPRVTNETRARIEAAVFIVASMTALYSNDNAKPAGGSEAACEYRKINYL